LVAAADTVARADYPHPDPAHPAAARARLFSLNRSKRPIGSRLAADWLPIGGSPPIDFADRRRLVNRSAPISSQAAANQQPIGSDRFLVQPRLNYISPHLA
jgi:hypothetical protein